MNLKLYNYDKQELTMAGTSICSTQTLVKIHDRASRKVCTGVLKKFAPLLSCHDLTNKLMLYLVYFSLVVCVSSDLLSPQHLGRQQSIALVAPDKSLQNFNAFGTRRKLFPRSTSTEEKFFVQPIRLLQSPTLDLATYGSFRDNSTTIPAIDFLNELQTESLVSNSKNRLDSKINFKRDANTEKETNSSLVETKDLSQPLSSLNLSEINSLPHNESSVPSKIHSMIPTATVSSHENKNYTQHQLHDSSTPVSPDSITSSLVVLALAGKTFRNGNDKNDDSDKKLVTDATITTQAVSTDKKVDTVLENKARRNDDSDNDDSMTIKIGTTPGSNNIQNGPTTIISEIVTQPTTEFNKSFGTPSITVTNTFETITNEASHAINNSNETSSIIDANYSVTDEIAPNKTFEIMKSSNSNVEPGKESYRNGTDGQTLTVMNDELIESIEIKGVNQIKNVTEKNESPSSAHAKFSSSTAQIKDENIDTNVKKTSESRTVIAVGSGTNLITVAKSKNLKFTMTAGKFWRFNLSPNTLNSTITNEHQQQSIRLKLYWNFSNNSNLNVNSANESLGVVEPVEDNDWIQYNDTTLQLSAWPTIRNQQQNYQSLVVNQNVYQFYLIHSNIDLEEATENNQAITPVAAITVIVNIPPYFSPQDQSLNSTNINLNHKFMLEYIPRNQNQYPRFLTQLVQTFERLVEIVNSITSSSSSTSQFQNQKSITVKFLSDILLYEWTTTPGGSSFAVSWSNQTILIVNNPTVAVKNSSLTTSAAIAGKSIIGSSPSGTTNTNSTLFCPIEQLQYILNRLTDPQHSPRVDRNQHQLLSISLDVRTALFGGISNAPTDGYIFHLDVDETCASSFITKPSVILSAPSTTIGSVPVLTVTPPTLRSIDAPTLGHSALVNATDQQQSKVFGEQFNVSTLMPILPVISLNPVDQTKMHNNDVESVLPRRAPSDLNVVISVNNKTVVENAGQNVPVLSLSISGANLTSHSNETAWDKFMLEEGEKVMKICEIQARKMFKFIDENLIVVSSVVCAVLLVSILIAFIVLCCRRHRKNSKSSFEPSNRFDFRYGSERRAFLKKSTKPVILDADVRCLANNNSASSNGIDVTPHSVSEPLKHMMKIVRVNGRNVRDIDNYQSQSHVPKCQRNSNSIHGSGYGLVSYGSSANSNSTNSNGALTTVAIGNGQNSSQNSSLSSSHQNANGYKSVDYKGSEETVPLKYKQSCR